MGVVYPADQSLWLNKNITIEGKCMFWKAWYEKGIIFVTGYEWWSRYIFGWAYIILCYQRSLIYLRSLMLPQTYSLDTNFLSTLQLRLSIAISWWTKLYNAHFPPSINQLVFQLPNSLRPITLTQLRTRQVHWFLLYIGNDIDKNKPECISKWNALFHNETLQWDKIFSTIHKLQKYTFPVFTVLITAWNYNI